MTSESQAEMEPDRVDEEVAGEQDDPTAAPEVVPFEQLIDSAHAPAELDVNAEPVLTVEA